MMPMTKVAIFYACGALIVGLLVASYQRVTFRWGKEGPEHTGLVARFLVGALGGALWPITLFVMTFPTGKPEPPNGK